MGRRPCYLQAEGLGFDPPILHDRQTHLARPLATPRWSLERGILLGWGYVLRVICCLVALAACGSGTQPLDDAGPRIDAAVDDAVDAVDAAVDAPVDAPPQPPATPSREIVGGAGRLTGATYTFDFELGHSVGQRPATSATYRIEGNAAIKP